MDTSRVGTGPQQRRNLVVGGWTVSEPDAADRDGKRHSRTQIAVAVIGAIGLVAAAYITGHATGSSSAPSTHHTATPVNGAGNPNVVIDVPQPALPGNQLPTVKCTTVVKGTANLPRGEALLIGNAEVGSKIYYYQPVSWPHPYQWISTIHPGTPGDSGHTFDVIAVVMPTRLKNYIVAAYQADRAPHGPFLGAPGLPPPPAKVVKQEKVRRAPCG
jgi:hypothetical protein